MKDKLIDKLKDLLEIIKIPLLCILIGIAAFIVVGAAIVVLLALLHNSDSTILYGIIGVLVLIGIPVGAYYSRVKWFFVASICLCVPSLLFLFYIWLS